MGDDFFAGPLPGGPRAWTPPPKRTYTRELIIVGLLIAMIGTLGAVAFAGHPTTTGPSRPRPGYQEAATRLLPAPAAGSSSSYSFFHLQRDGVTPVTWSPCRPIHYVVRPNDAPPQGAALLADAFAQLSRATGLEFVNDGGTQEAPTNDRSPYQPRLYGDRWAPVLIVWATPAEVPDFGADVLGETAPMLVDAPDHTQTYVSGIVALDARRMTTYLQAPGTASFARTIVMHELGHLVGLGHVLDQYQVMYPSGVETSYQAGDLAGLAILGRGPCQPSV